MPGYEWNVEKNKTLKVKRGISFEDIISAIDQGNLLEVRAHPKQKYRHQKIYVVKIRDYVYHVPFVEDEKKKFLKTIIPSRKSTKEFLRK